MEKLLEVKNVSVSFESPAGEIPAVRDVSLSLKYGEVLAIVGESGCGKSVLCKTIMKLLPEVATVKSGSIRMDGADVTNYGEREMQKLRGELFSMVFQNPRTALNPTMSIGKQIEESVALHAGKQDKKLSKKQRREKSLELMRLVGIENAGQRYEQYPHQLSGGLCQRAVLAAALASEPKLLFADEPTSSLDVTIQAQILDLLYALQKKLGMAMVLVTHDFGVVARLADRVAVMLDGEIVETGTAEEIFAHPKHPYTKKLIRIAAGYYDTMSLFKPGDVRDGRKEENG